MKILEKTLDCGMPLYVVPFESPVSFYQLFTYFGSTTLSYEDPDTHQKIQLTPGSAHYFEHVLFSIDPKYGMDDSMSWMEKNRALSTNAYTQHDVTCYHFAGMENNDTNLDMLLEYVLDVSPLTQKRFDREVGIILDEESMYFDEPEEALDIYWHRQAFQKHGAKEMIIGTPDDIRSMNLQQVLSLHNTFYRPENMVLMVVGKDDINVVAERANAKLAQMGVTNRPIPRLTPPKEPYAVAKKDNFDSPLMRKDVATPLTFAGWKVEIDPQTMNSDQLVKRHAGLALIDYVFFGEGSSRLQRVVDRGIRREGFYSVAGGNFDFGFITAQSDHEDPREFAALLQDMIYSGMKEGITAKEVAYAQDSFFAENRKPLAFGDVAYDIERWTSATRNPHTYNQFRDVMEEFTADELNEVLQEVVHEESFTAVTAQPTDDDVTNDRS